MLPGKREEAEAHEHVLADDERGNRRVHQTRIPHGSSQTDHEGLIGDGIDQCAKTTALVEVPSNVAITEVQNAGKRERCESIPYSTPTHQTRHKEALHGHIADRRGQDKANP